MCLLLLYYNNPFSSFSLWSQPASFSHLDTNSIQSTFKNCFSAVYINIRSPSFQVLGHCEPFSSVASRSLVPALPHAADFSLLIGCEVHPGRGRAGHDTESCKSLTESCRKQSEM